jgi:hypothetical protein
MVQFRIDDQQVATFDDGAFTAVLEAAGLAGGAEAFPVLVGLPATNEVVDPLSVVDELGRLAATEHGQQVAMLIGTLRDDLMEAVAAAEEG